MQDLSLVLMDVTLSVFFCASHMSLWNIFTKNGTLPHSTDLVQFPVHYWS